MKTACIFGTLAAVACLTIGALAADKAEPVNKLDLLAMRPDRAADRIVEQFRDLLILPDKYDGPRPQFLLEGRWYQMAPHGTDIPGLCESRSITFHFDPLRLEPQDSTTPTRVSSVELGGRQFRFRDLPRDPDAEMTKAERMSLNAHCRDEGYDFDKYFSADNAKQAFEAMWVIEAMKTQVAKPPECDYDPAKVCSDIFSDLLKGAAFSVQRCESANQKPGLECLEFNRGDADFRVFYSFRAPAARIDHIIGELTIIIADYRME